PTSPGSMAWSHREQICRRPGPASTFDNSSRGNKPSCTRVSAASISHCGGETVSVLDEPGSLNDAIDRHSVHSEGTRSWIRQQKFLTNLRYVCPRVRGACGSIAQTSIPLPAA